MFAQRQAGAATWARWRWAPPSTSARRSRRGRSRRSARPSSTPTSWGWPPCSGATCATPPSRPRRRTTTCRPTSPGRPTTSASRIEADIIKQKLPENNGGYNALYTKENPYGKTDKRVYDRAHHRQPDRPDALPGGQLLHGPRGPDQLRRRLQGESDFAEAVKTAVINKRAGGMGLISGRKAFQRPMAEGVQLLNADPGRLPEQGDHDRLKDRRVRARVAVHGDVLGKIHATSPAPVVNLSETGALVEVDCVLRPGHRADAAPAPARRGRADPALPRRAQLHPRVRPRGREKRAWCATGRPWSSSASATRSARPCAPRSKGPQAEPRRRGARRLKRTEPLAVERRGAPRQEPAVPDLGPAAAGGRLHGARPLDARHDGARGHAARPRQRAGVRPDLRVDHAAPQGRGPERHPRPPAGPAALRRGRGVRGAWTRPRASSSSGSWTSRT